jgi:hypothetical protein
VVEQSSDPRLFDEHFDPGLANQLVEQIRALDLARRDTVFRSLAAMGMPVSTSDVVVGKPACLGMLQGATLDARSEPEYNFRNLLNQTERRGDPALLPAIDRVSP